MKMFFSRVLSQLERNADVQIAMLSGIGLISMFGILLTYVIGIAPYVR